MKKVRSGVRLDKSKALEFGVSGPIGLQRYQATDDIWHLVTGCYEFDTNPLPILRRAIPNFKWEFHDLLLKKKVHAALCDRVLGSDFFWFPNVFYDNLVTARRIDSAGWPFNIIGHTFQSMRESCANDAEGMIRLLQSWGVREDRENH